MARRDSEGHIEALDYLSDFEIPLNAQCESLALSVDGQKIWLSCEGEAGILASASCATTGSLEGSEQDGETESGPPSGCATGPGLGTLSLWFFMTFSLARRSLRIL